MLTPPSEPAAPGTPEAALLRIWRRERWLGYAHALNPPLCLLLIPLVPGVSRLLTLLLATALALGTAGQLLLLRSTPRSDRLRAARALATAIEWTGGLGGIALCAPEPTVPTPAVLLILPILAGGRYGLRGLLAATAAGWLTIGALVGVQMRLLGVSDPAAVRVAGVVWALAVGVMGLALALSAGVAAARRQCAPPLATPAIPPLAAPRPPSASPPLSRERPPPTGVRVSRPCARRVRRVSRAGASPPRARSGRWRLAIRMASL